MGIYTIVNHENWLVDSTVLESLCVRNVHPIRPELGWDPRWRYFWDGLSPPVSISTMKRSWYNNWLVVWIIFYFSIYWECHHPNWLSDFSEGLKPPNRYDIAIVVLICRRNQLEASHGFNQSYFPWVFWMVHGCRSSEQLFGVTFRHFHTPLTSFNKPPGVYLETLSPQLLRSVWAGTLWVCKLDKLRQFPASLVELSTALDFWCCCCLDEWHTRNQWLSALCQEIRGENFLNVRNIGQRSLLWSLDVVWY